VIELKALPMHWKGNNLGIKIQIYRAIFVSAYIPFLRNVANAYLKKNWSRGLECRIRVVACTSNSLIFFAYIHILSLLFFFNGKINL
jgi:hypothetical protein